MPAKRRSFARPNVTTRAAASAFPFFKLPAEIRNMIYGYALGWTYATDCIAKGRYPEAKTPQGRKYRWTPGILLVNQQFYSESVIVAYKKTVRIHQPHSSMDIIWCFSAATLRRLRFVTFEIDLDRDAELALSDSLLNSGWCVMTISLASVWHLQHNLQLLKMTIRDRKEPSSVRDRSRKWRAPRGLDEYLVRICSPLRAISRVKEVVIERDIPIWYASERKIQMEAEPGQGHRHTFDIINHPAPTARVVESLVLMYELTGPIENRLSNRTL